VVRECGPPSNRRRFGTIGYCDYWMPAFAGMTALLMISDDRRIPHDSD
jgi:hypothetical protein